MFINFIGQCFVMLYLFTGVTELECISLFVVSSVKNIDLYINNT